jgi:hypothetical protein
MRRQAILGALMLVGVGVVLGATVFRADIAQAAGLAKSVTVDNTPAQAVPVREQNLDGSNVRVHEEGTAKVKVTNGSLPVDPPTPVTGGGGGQVIGAGVTFSFAAETASALSIHMDSGIDAVVLHAGGETPAAFEGPNGGGSANIALALTRPITFDQIKCLGSSGTCSVSWVGNVP